MSLPGALRARRGQAPGTAVTAITSLALAVLWATPAGAASLQQVTDWGATGVPSYVDMYVYVPDQLATKPPIVVASHYCTGTASAYFDQLKSTIVAAADAQGFLMIFPQATGRNCWDAGSAASLSHDGGGDTEAIVQMVRYAISEYDADATRVYAMGGSSGGMITQALIGVYPDVFKAGVEIAGVPCGCWAVGYDQGGTPQWSNDCAGGRVNKTAEEWGALVRAMFPEYAGHRPRVQLWHGTNDTTIDYDNFLESIEEWTNVLGLSATPTMTDMPKAGFTRQRWNNGCGFTVLEAWSQEGGTHAIQTDANAILGFLGVNETGPDPEDAACGGGGQAGTGGSGAQGGAAGMLAAGSGRGGAFSGGAGGAIGRGGSGVVGGAGSGGSDSGGRAVTGGGGASGGDAGRAVGGAGGGGTGTSGNGGRASGGAGGPGEGESGKPSGGTTGNVAGSSTNAVTHAGQDGGGCGCFVVGRSNRREAAPLLLLAALGFSLRRRNLTRRVRAEARRLRAR